MMLLRSEFRMLEGMQPEDARAFDVALESIELRNFPFVVELERQRDHLAVSMRVRDRDTGTPKIVVVPFTIPHPSYWIGGAMSRWIYDCLKTALLHELDEAFHVDGVRVRDPHGDA